MISKKKRRKLSDLSLFDEDKIKSSCIFSEDRVYRYSLIREWRDDLPRIVFCLLNPSTADEDYNDPTVAGCMKRAINWGFGSIQILNIFAYRSTDPKGLYHYSHPEGPWNDLHILIAKNTGDKIVCGWGNHGLYKNRGYEVRLLLTGGNIHYLKLNKNGEPQHPLYIKHAILPTKWE